MWLSNSTPGYISEKKKKTTQKDTGTPTFIAALFIIPKIWKKQVTINRWINKDLVCVCVYIYVMEYYSDIKKKNFPFAATWMDLENITLSEINQTERDKYCMTSLICRIYKIQQTTANTVHIRKKKQTYRHREQTSRQCRGEGMGRITPEGLWWSLLMLGPDAGVSSRGRLCCMSGQ